MHGSQLTPWKMRTHDCYSKILIMIVIVNENVLEQQKIWMPLSILAMNI